MSNENQQGAAGRSRPAAPVSRRELNRSATRTAIAEAALQLVRTKGPGGFTVEQIAQAADISRRTFFNYFPSIEAALAVGVEDFLDEVIAYFELRPATEPVLDSMLAALSHPSDEQALQRVGELYKLANDHPELKRFQLDAWDRAERHILAAIVRRLGDTADTLYTSALVGSVMGSGRAALAEWMRQTGGDGSEASVARIKQLFIDVIGFLRSGFVQ